MKSISNRKLTPFAVQQFLIVAGRQMIKMGNKSAKRKKKKKNCGTKRSYSIPLKV